MVIKDIINIKKIKDLLNFDFNNRKRDKIFLEKINFAKIETILICFFKWFGL